MSIEQAIELRVAGLILASRDRPETRKQFCAWCNGTGRVQELRQHAAGGTAAESGPCKHCGGSGDLAAPFREPWYRAFGRRKRNG